MKILRLITPYFAMLTLALATTAHAEQIYRCGNSYSQVPCAQGKVLTIDDTSDAARKKAADAATRRDAQLANQLEQERLQQEQALKPKSGKSAKPKAVKSKKAASAPVQDQPTTLTPKRPRSVMHKHKDFTALVPGSGQKPKAAASK